MRTDELLGWAVVLVAGLLFLGLVAAVPTAIGFVLLGLAQQDRQPGIFASWLTGAIVISVLLLLLFFFVGFVRFSWYAWG